MAKSKGMRPSINQYEDFTNDLGWVDPKLLYEIIKHVGIYVYDIETTGLDPRKDRLEGIAFHVPAGTPKDFGPLGRYDGKPLRAWFPFRDFSFMCHIHVRDIPGLEPKLAPIGVNMEEIYRTARYEDGSPRRPDELILVNLRPPMDQEATMEALRPIWQELREVIGITHHGKFDSGFLWVCPGTVHPIRVRNVWADSMLADFASDERRKKYGLKTRIKQEFNHQMTPYAEAVRGQSLLAFCNAKPLGVYAMDDCYWEWRLHERSIDSLRAQEPPPKNRTELKWTIEQKFGRPLGRLERVYWGIDTRISEIIMEMQNAGVLIDWQWLKEVDEKIVKQKEEIAQRIEAFLGWPLNPNATQQVADALFAPPPDGLGLPQKGIPIGKTGIPSTSDKVIKHFARFHPLVADIIKWRSLDTIQGSFVKKLIKLALDSSDGRVYANFNQTRTVIARLSSSDPINFQNQPRDKNLVRKAYCAHRTGIETDDPDMVLLGGDYGQIELRVAAHLSKEENMLEVYRMGGICSADNGQPCERYRVWTCEAGDCGHTWTPALWTAPNKSQVCPKCGSKEKTEHQARCRHVDLHQRTAEDAKVKRNPLAKCLDGSTLVSTTEGVRPIGDVIGMNGAAGEHSALLEAVDDGRGGFVKSFSGLFRHNRPTKIVVTKRAVVIATNDHRFEVLGDGLGTLDPTTPGYKPVLGRSLVEASRLEKGMKLPVAVMGEAARKGGSDWHYYTTPQVVRLNPFTKEIGDGPATITLNEDWAYFAGIFQGDGCASGNACVITHGHTDDYEPWRQIARDACDAIGLPTSVSGDKRQTRLGSRVVRRYLEGLDLCKEVGATGEKTMRIPRWVLDGGPGIWWSYIAGLFDTDGTVGGKESGTVSVTTKYPEFAGQIAFLLRHMGMPVLVQPGFNKTYERWYYTIHVLGEGLERFQRYCPLRHPGKRKRLVDRNDTIKRRCAPTDDEVLLVLDGGERTVYDFQVENEDHLYLQGGLVGHNNLNFGLLYRMGAPKFCIYADLFDSDGLPMIAFAKDVIERWHTAYPAIAIFHEMTEFDLKQNGWIAKTLFGRRRRLDQEARINHFRAVTQGVQFQVSGTAQDIMKTGMIRTWEAREQKIESARPAEKKLWERFRFLMQIHDECIWEIPKQIADEAKIMVKGAMEGVGKGSLLLPLTFDTKTGRTWDDIH